MGGRRSSAHRLCAWPAPSHRLFWSHPRCAAAPHLPLTLTIRGSSPQSCAPSLLAARGPLAALLSPVPVQSSPVPDTSIRCTSLDRRQPAPEPARTAPWKSHHPPDCCHLCCPPPPTHSPTSRPASKTALLCSCCRVARPALPLVPTCCIGPGNCKSHTLGCCTALLLINPQTSINLVPTSVSHPPSV